MSLLKLVRLVRSGCLILVWSRCELRLALFLPNKRKIDKVAKENHIIALRRVDCPVHDLFDLLWYVHKRMGTGVLPGSSRNRWGRIAHDRAIHQLGEHRPHQPRLADALRSL